LILLMQSTQTIEREIVKESYKEKLGYWS
jgi:hypothetical protein